MRVPQHLNPFGLISKSWAGSTWGPKRFENLAPKGPKYCHLMPKRSKNWYSCYLSVLDISYSFYKELSQLHYDRHLTLWAHYRPNLTIHWIFLRLKKRIYSWYHVIPQPGPKIFLWLPTNEQRNPESDNKTHVVSSETATRFRLQDFGTTVTGADLFSLDTRAKDCWN